MRAIPSALSFIAILALSISTGAQVPDSTTLAGVNWRSIGPVNMAGRITDVEVDPRNPKVFYVAGATGGLWKTVNAGTTFIPLWENGPIASLGDIAISPSNPDVIWLGTGEEDSRNSIQPGYGIYKSTDGGLTWRSMGLEKTQHIGRIIVHPTNPDIVWVSALGAAWGSNPERGLYKTTDGGRTWTLSKFISDKAGFIDIAIDPRNPNVLFAASYERVRGPYFLKSGGPGSALWRTGDGGATWREVRGGGFPETTKGRISVVIAPSNPNVIYTMVEADSVRGEKPQRLRSGVYRSTDGGNTWRWMSVTNNRPFYFSQIRVDPKNPNRLYRMAVDFAFSDDGGYSWRTGMLGIHEDYHAMWINPNDPDHFIVGGDAGLFQTHDKGGTYDGLNNFAMAQFYGISYDFQVPYRVCGGMQDNGTSCGISRRRGAQLQMTDWFAIFAADGLQTAQDPVNPEFVYYESQGGNIARRNLATGETMSLRPRTVTVNQYANQLAQIRGDGSRPLTPEQEQQIAGIRQRMRTEMADPAVANRWNWNTPFILSRHNPMVYYVGANKLFKSVKRGEAAVAISPDLSARNPDWLRVSSGFDADANPATDASGGITRDATGAEENGTIVTIDESPLRPGMLYVGTNDGKVWLTRNDGGTWEDLSGRFTGVPPLTHVSKVAPSHHDTGTVYVTFDNHRVNDFKPYVFVSNDYGRTFRSISAGLPSDRPASTYVIAEDPVNPNLIYVGNELGVWASLNKGASWFGLRNRFPTVPVYDLKVHPRDRELVAGTHGRGIMILDVAPLQQMNADVLGRAAHLFAPAVALQYGQMPAPSEMRAHRGWRAEGGPSGAVISYRLTASTDSARISIVNAAGDTVARLRGPGTAGLHRVEWGMAVSPSGQVNLGRGGRGGQPAANVPGFPPGFIPRPAESAAAPDSSASPTAQARALAAGGAGRGGRGGRGGGGGRGGFGGFAGNAPAVTADYRVILEVAGQRMAQPLRVVVVPPGVTSLR
jgi:photosystem II stability/assembly factor-like uncharacterized protein